MEKDKPGDWMKVLITNQACKLWSRRQQIGRTEFDTTAPRIVSGNTLLRGKPQRGLRIHCRWAVEHRIPRRRLCVKDGGGLDIAMRGLYNHMNIGWLKEAGPAGQQLRKEMGFRTPCWRALT